MDMFVLLSGTGSKISTELPVPILTKNNEVAVVQFNGPKNKSQPIIIVGDFVHRSMHNSSTTPIIGVWNQNGINIPFYVAVTSESLSRLSLDMFDVSGNNIKSSKASILLHFRPISVAASDSNKY